MRYKIRNVIKRNGIGRTDLSVVGRIVEFDLLDIRKQIGSNNPVFIKCITDCAGIPYPAGQKVSMPLKNILSINWFYGKQVVVVEDRKAIYTFDRV